MPQARGDKVWLEDRATEEGDEKERGVPPAAVEGEEVEAEACGLELGKAPKAFARDARSEASGFTLGETGEHGMAGGRSRGEAADNSAEWEAVSAVCAKAAEGDSSAGGNERGRGPQRLTGRAGSACA